MRPPDPKDPVVLIRPYDLSCSSDLVQQWCYGRAPHYRIVRYYPTYAVLANLRVCTALRISDERMAPSSTSDPAPRL